MLKSAIDQNSEGSDRASHVGYVINITSFFYCEIMFIIGNLENEVKLLEKFIIVSPLRTNLIINVLIYLFAFFIFNSCL